MLHKYVSDYPSGVRAWRVASGPAQSTQGTRRSDDTWDMMTYDDTWWPRPWWHMMTHVITYDDTWWHMRYDDTCDHTLWYLMSHNHTWSHIMTQIERDDKWWHSVMLLSIPNSHNHAVVRHWDSGPIVSRLKWQLCFLLSPCRSPTVRQRQSV